MTKHVLFVCVHNAGRSRMAEAWFNQVARQRQLDLEAHSAGTIPAARPHPEVVAAMAELGVAISAVPGVSLTDAMVTTADRIITMGCQVDAEACPAIFVKGVEDWGLPDPKGQGVAAVRTIRDEIRRRVEALIDALQTEM